MASANHSTPSILRTALATGDLIYRAASSTWARAAIGSTGDILSVVAGIPAWKSLRAALDSAGASFLGDMWVSNSIGTISQVSSSTDGKVLTTHSTASAPTWEWVSDNLDAEVSGFARGDMLRSDNTGPALAKFSAKTAGALVSGDGNDVVSQAPHLAFDAATAATSAQGDLWFRGASAIARLARPVKSSALVSPGGANNVAWRLLYRFNKLVDEVCDNGAGGTHNHTSGGTGTGASIQNDITLFTELESGVNYAFRLVVSFQTASGNGDLKWDVAYSGTEDVFRLGHYVVAAPAVTATYDRQTAQPTTETVTVAAATVGAIYIHGLIHTTGAGTLIFRWAQNSAHADDVTILRESIMEVWEQVR